MTADLPSLRLLAQQQHALHNLGVRLLVCHAGVLTTLLLAQGLDPASFRPTADLALETMEDWLLAECGDAHVRALASELADCDLVAGLEPTELEALVRITEPRSFASGDTLVRAGDAGDALYFLLEGSVEVRLTGEAGAPPVRVDVFSAGMSFGEMAFVDGAPRSADVVALDAVACRVLALDAFDALEQEHPRLKIRLLEAITRQMSRNIRRINAEVLALRA